MAEPTFNDRMFLASQAVYESIERGEHPDVEASLMDAHLTASDDES
ncbi:hypothetical protein GCM10023084_03060 [Streptomyces lacrimifluminis]